MGKKQKYFWVAKVIHKTYTKVTMCKHGRWRKGYKWHSNKRPSGSLW